MYIYFMSLLAMFQCPTSLDDVPQSDCESLLYRLQCCLCSISIFRTPNLWATISCGQHPLSSLLSRNKRVS
ncbi:hypothetical protein P692DRAFT_2060025 [Suillus brevipes Sb2]|nr:hypothetical protein P692DRAFT_2060025 [Suillus brevipes Sb2]